MRRLMDFQTGMLDYCWKLVINYAEVIYTYYVECCEAISRLTVAEIEVLYLDESHA